MQNQEVALVNRLQEPIAIRVWLAAILALGLIRSAIWLIIIPDQALMPDEELYAVVLQALANGQNITDVGNQLGYGPRIFTGSWVLLKTGQFLSIFGLGAIDSLRLASIFFSVLSLLIVLDIIVRVRGLTLRGSRFGPAILSAPGLALLALLLMPSNHIWGSTGLREASTVLSCALVAWGLSIVTLRSGSRNLILGLLGLFLGIAGIHLSRSYLAFFLTITVAFAVLLPPIRGRQMTIGLVIGVITLANLLGSHLQSQVPPPEQRSSDTTASVELKTAVELETSVQPAPERSRVFWQLLDSRVTNFHINRENFRDGAGSAYATNYCAPPQSAVSAVGCELANLPIGVYRFLLTPNVLKTGFEAPRQRLFAGLENLLWLLIYCAALATVFGRYSLSWRQTVFLASFLVITTVAYALISGNEGTAFRHKGQFLWAWCLVVALGCGWRPWVRALVPKRERNSANVSES